MKTFFIIFLAILAAAAVIFGIEQALKVAQLQRQSPTTSATAKGQNPFAEEERKDRYELVKTDYKIQENLPEVISYFKGKKDSDPSSVEARTQQAILKLCEELSAIVPKIIAAKADGSVANLVARQRQIFKSLDAILASEQAAEMETRYHVSELKAELMRIDREYNQKVLDLLSR